MQGLDSESHERRLLSNMTKVGERKEEIPYLYIVFHSRFSMFANISNVMVSFSNSPGRQ